jgi:hypothetical protein
VREILATVGSPLPLPDELRHLIDIGFWPDKANANSQNLHPLADREAIARIAPGEPSLWLDPPPFATLARLVLGNADFWNEHGALGEIDPELALVIGDFGLGSDAPIVLDYRVDAAANPRVMRLAWTDDGNHWIELAQSFATFAQALGFPYHC